MNNRRSWKRWRESEIRVVLNYLISSIQASGNLGFKPASYYKNMIVELRLEMPVKALQQRIERIKSKYKDFVIWNKTIGVRIQSETARAVASKKKFVWYVECQKLWGKDISIHPPYLSPPTNIGRPKREDL